MSDKYDDYDWDELPADVKAAAEKLGYTKKIWDSDGEPDECDEYWKDLTAEQQAAAKLLGYTAATWDAED
ncbi:hypothetical protein CTEN210_12543 [Chaetoceros tenuissimus]|uniref:Uncharacterized protein n=1 Tax=Chaetoceros tenuissimus TaxID=426638 RepID=A0AAD3D1D7_9STRA|nr:hypothetical protein CTEN210_12543 [Chaetoceros tenuissimus]